LIDKGCDLKLLTNDEDRSKYINSGLVIATAANGHIDVLELLFQTGVSVNKCSSYGKTPLTAAATRGHVATVAFLLEQGANINGADATGASTKNHSCANADSDSDDDDKDDWGRHIRFQRRSPLYCAIEAGQGEVAELLIERGADTSNSCDGNKSLAELAAKHGLSDIVEQLVDNENFRFDQVVDGDTLLASAAGRGHFQSVRYLLQKGADVNAKNMSGDTALTSVLQFAERRHVLDVVKLLFSFGADINLKNCRAETPLHLACNRNFDRVAEYLPELGCETESKNCDYYSPLHHAAEHNNGKLAEMLF